MRNVFAKVLSLCLSVAVLSTVCCFSISAEETTTDKYILYDDFENDDASPENWQVYSDETLATVTVEAEDGNKFLRLKATEGVVNNGANVHKQPIAITKPGKVNFKLSETEKLVITARIRHNETLSGSMSSLRLGYPYKEENFTDSISASYAIFGFRERTLRFLHYNGSNTQSWLATASGFTAQTDVWYDTKVVIDPATKKYNLSVTDGTNTVNVNCNMTREGSDSYFNELDLVKSLSFKITGPSSADTYMDVDDVKIYKVYSAPTAELLTDGGYLPANTKAINVKFNKDMDESTLSDSTVVLEDKNGNPVSYYGEYDKESHTYKIDPDEDLVPGDTYTVKLDDAIYAANVGETGDADYDAGKLAGTKEFSFEATAPKSDNARLSSIILNGEPFVEFDPDVTDYTVKLQYSENVKVPAVEAVTEDASAAEPVITYPDSTNGTIVIKSVAEDGVTVITYNLKLKVVGEAMAKLGENLMVNPDFETGTVDGYMASANFVIDSSDAHTGNYSGKSIDRTNPQTNFYRQDVKIKANRTYLLAGWFKTKTGTEQYEIFPNSSNVDRPYRDSEAVSGSPTEWKRVILTVVTKADTSVSPSILSWSTTEDYRVDDLYVGELKPSVIYKGIDMITVDRTAEKRATLYADIVNQFGTKNGIGAAQITEWRIVSAPYGVTTDGDELVVSKDAEAGKAYIDIVFNPNYVGSDRVLDEDIPEWTHRIEITVNDDNEPIPYAKDLTIDGTVAKDSVISANYRYYHKDGVEEKLPANIQWLYSDTPYGHYNAIPGATEKDYTVEEAYADKFIRVKILPEAVDGSVGPETTSEKYVYKNVAPTATVTVEKPDAYAIGDTLKGKYVYEDLNLDEEGETTFRWLRYNKETKKYEAIDNATSDEYILTENDAFTTLKFEVTPASVVENEIGQPALSSEVNGPDKPYIENLRIVLNGTVATSAYDYKHPNGVPEGESIVNWYVNGIKRGEGTTCIVSKSDSLKVEVIPVASKEPAEGDAVTASKAGTSSGGSGGGGGGGVSAGTIVKVPEVTVVPEKSEVFLSGDEANHWGASAMNWAIQYQYMSKDSDGNFNPEREYSREEFLTSILKMVGMQPKAYKGIFADVEDGEFARLLQAAVDNNIISVDEKFYPERNVSREEVCKIVVTSLAAMGLDNGTEGDISKFTDKAEIGTWAEGYIAKMLGTGLMQGADDGRFMPKGNLTKAQTATILRRLSDYTKNLKEGK